MTEAEATVSVQRWLQVNLELAISTVVGLGFGTPLIMAYFPTSIFPERAKAYQSATILVDMVADGFTINDPAYKMAQALISQSIKPQQIIVGRKVSPLVQAIDLLPTTDSTDEEIEVTISYKGDTETYVQAGLGTGIQATAAALAVQIAAGKFGGVTPDYITATAPTTACEVRNSAGFDTGQILYYSGLKNCEILDVSADPGIVADLVAISAADNSWYWLTSDSNSKLEIAAMANQIESDYKIFATQTQDTEVADGTVGSICLVLQLASYNRTFVNFTANSLAEYPACRVVARAAPRPPGSYELAWKTYPGWTAGGVDNSALNEIENAGGNALVLMTEFQGQTKYSGGKTPSGSWIDYWHTIDALRARIWLELIAMLQAEGKIVYNQAAGEVTYSGQRVPGSVGGEHAVEAIQVSVGGIDQEAGGKAFNTDSLATNYIPHQYQSPSDINQRIFSGVTFEVVILTAVGAYRITGTLRLISSAEQEAA
jgi:hypothetical protein